MNPDATTFQLSTPLILDMPDRLSVPRRLAYRALTLVFWMGWIYLWIPLITLLGWLSGIAFFREQIVVQQGWQSFIDNLPTYSLVVFMMAGTLLLWAITNWFRFANREARKAVSRVTLQEQADQLQVSKNNLSAWQKQKHMVVHHDDHGRILKVTD
ncbi:MAG: poly-beta-1,6-N-acetyl-D-glucosamine biosynthesis protein PgaD [Burkholderiales bacterium]